jgi:hypothetical protein
MRLRIALADAVLGRVRRGDDHGIHDGALPPQQSGFLPVLLHDLEV